MGENIFINYRREEAQSAAGRLYDLLESTFGREHIFFDVDSIAPGRDFVEELSARVSECDIFLAVIGRGWIDVRDYKGGRRIDSPTDWVRIELESALKQKKHVIPVLVDGAEMPRVESLPAGLAPFARRNAVRLTHDRFRSDVQGLVNALQKLRADWVRQELERRERQAEEEAAAERCRAAEEEERRAEVELAKRAVEEEAQRRADEAQREKENAERAEAERRALAAQQDEEDRRRRTEADAAKRQVEEQERHRAEEAQRETQRTEIERSFAATRQEEHGEPDEAETVRFVAQHVEAPACGSTVVSTETGDALFPRPVARSSYLGVEAVALLVLAVVGLLYLSVRQPDYGVGSSPPTTEYQPYYLSADGQFQQGQSSERAKDYAQALSWYRKAADQGYAPAQDSIGDLYYYGRGVKQDYAQAAAWFRKAADQGYAPAQNSIGVLYYSGLGVEKDYGEASTWFQKAADQGDAKAQYNIGLAYYHGRGVRKDYATATAWFRKAADQGDADAQKALGELYTTGASRQTSSP